MWAIIETGGKQYLVSPDDKIKVEKLKAQAGEEIVFDQVLLVEKNRQLKIGEPMVKGAKVTAKVLSQGKAKKVIAFRYKAKTRHKVKKGHRQQFTEVQIKGIEV